MSLPTRYWKPILAIGSAVTGAILGAAAQELLNTDLRLLAAIVVVLSVLTIGALTMLMTTMDARRAADEQIVEHARALADSHAKETARLSGQVDAVGRRLTEELHGLAKRFGLQVERLLYKDLNAGPLEDDRTARLVFAATKELRVLDMLSEDGHWPDEALDDDYSRQYFTTLTETIRNSSPTVAYRRIVQVDDPLTSLAEAKAPGFVRHCRQMLDLRETKRHKISLRVAQRRFPFKFILIDRAHLVLQLHEYHSSTSDARVWGEILISDATGDLIDIFEDLWDEMNEDPRTRTVTAADLPGGGS